MLGTGWIKAAVPWAVAVASLFGVYVYIGALLPIALQLALLQFAGSIVTAIKVRRASGALSSSAFETRADPSLYLTNSLR